MESENINVAAFLSKELLSSKVLYYLRKFKSKEYCTILSCNFGYKKSSLKKESLYADIQLVPQAGLEPARQKRHRIL
ncbi:MAG: hypothetical protein ACOVRK_00470, partial [Chryseobacterium taeanense]